MLPYENEVDFLHLIWLYVCVDMLNKSPIDAYEYENTVSYYRCIVQLLKQNILALLEHHNKYCRCLQFLSHRHEHDLAFEQGGINWFKSPLTQKGITLNHPNHRNHPNSFWLSPTDANHCESLKSGYKSRGIMSRKGVLFKEIRVSFHPTLDVIWSSYNRSLYLHNSILYRLIVGVRHVNSFDRDDNVACLFNASVACRDKGFWVLRQELGYRFRRIGLPRKRVPNGIMMATTSPKRHSFSFCHLDRRRTNDENVYYRSFSNGSHWPFQRCSGRSHISIRRALFCRNAIVNHGHTHPDQCHRTSFRRFGVKARWLL